MNYPNIRKMRNTIKNNQGFDVVIIVSSGGNSGYWERRLFQTRDYILARKTKIISLEEDWRGNAGQLLGTLYAFQKAHKILDLNKILENKGTVAIYHTAGHGKRMAPLTAAEGNNKPAIKLPRSLTTKEGKKFLTILEGVIFSTQIFSPSREGRISVFWGDQIIIPSEFPAIETKLPVEIFGIKEKLILNKENWEKDWKNYGILISTGSGEILQREKFEWEKVKQLQERGQLKLNSEGKVNVSKSMGCFSVSFDLFQILLDEFSKETKEKKGTLDTDPHLWMPLTSAQEEYADQGGNIAHFKRIRKLKERFQKETGEWAIVGEKNLGKGSIWWDYGNLASYYKNLLRVATEGEEGEKSRKFFGIEDFFVREKNNSGLKIKNSILIDSKIKEGKIENSVLAGCRIGKAEIKGSFLLNTKIKEVDSKNNLFYSVKEKEKIIALPDEVITDVLIEEGKTVRIKTNLYRDGKKDWKEKLPSNLFSYEKIEKLVSELNKRILK